jgi:hypothetical protein
VQALALAQLGVGVGDGGIQPLQQEIQDARETIGLHLGNILEGNLASVEVVNHREYGHKPLFSLYGRGMSSALDTRALPSRLYRHLRRDP